MKKFALTTFAVLYALLLFFVSVERSVLAVQEVEGGAHRYDTQHSHGFGKQDKSETHLSKRKPVETEFVVELPREAATRPIRSERYVPLPSFEHHITPCDRPFSSRAPPFNA